MASASPPPPPPSRRSGRKDKPDGTTRALTERPKKRWGKRIGLGILFTFLFSIIVGCVGFFVAYSKVQVPAPDEFALAQTSRVFYEDSATQLGSFSEVNRTIIDTEKIPAYVGQAIVASEDRTFFTNSGIDVKGMARALITNITTNSRQGGSTLSQQYVENYYVGESITDYLGKVREAILALKINREQSKEEILGNYMNAIYFGRGSYGIEAASQAYFGHSAEQMTLSEAAMIAGIIPSPGGWDPAIDLEQAQSRWQRVLDYMVEDGWITAQEAASQVFPETIDPAEQQSSMSGVDGYLMQQVREELIDSGAFTPEEIDKGGLNIVTSINQSMQQAAVEAVAVMPEDTPANLKVALSSIDNATGEILAEYPGSDYQSVQINSATQDIAMAGSTFKPFTLLTSLEKGGSIYERFDGNSPMYFANLAAPVENYGNFSYGNVDMLTATRNSLNTPYVALNEKVGPASTMETLIKAGIPEDTVGLEASLLNVLGFAAPHNIDLARAYATIANGGNRVDPHIVRSVTDNDGNVLYRAEVVFENEFSSETVSKLLPALKAVVEPGASAARASINGHTVAGKTGTSEEQRSAQFIGFIPQVTTAVSMYMVGEDGGSIPLPNIGGLAQFDGSDWPVEVWVAYMEKATTGMEVAQYSWYKEVNQNKPQVTIAPSPTPTPEPSQTTDPEPTVPVTPLPSPSETPDPLPSPDPDPEPTPEPSINPSLPPSPQANPTSPGG